MDDGHDDAALDPITWRRIAAAGAGDSPVGTAASAHADLLEQAWALPADRWPIFVACVRAGLDAQVALGVAVPLAPTAAIRPVLPSGEAPESST